jgi:hypothetical protein
LQAGFTCKLEDCGQHFSCMADFTEHTQQHKEQMKKRLVCTQDVSKTAVCGEKFTNRRAYNEHVEEHKSVFRAKTFSG